MKNVIQERLDRMGKEQRDILEHFELNGRKVTQSHLNRVIRGEQDPTAWMMFGIADFFNCYPSEIFYPTRDEIYGGKE